MGNLIGVSRTPPKLSDLLQVNNLPVSPSSTSGNKPPISPKSSVPIQQQQQQQQQNAPIVVELFSSYLFMWRVYVDHKNQLMIQYDPVDLLQFKKFNSNDCYIVLHVINNSELYKQIQHFQENSSGCRSATTSLKSVIPPNLIHYHHQQHQLFHNLHHNNQQQQQQQTTTTTSTLTSTSSNDDITSLKSFMTSAQSELTPRGLSCPAGVFSFDPISHIETEEISHDVYIWNGKNSDPLTKAFCIAKGFDFVKALKYSDTNKHRNEPDSNSSNNCKKDDKMYWKLPNTSLIIQKLFQATTETLSPNSNKSNSSFGALSNYFIDDLTPQLDKSINSPSNQQQNLYNNFHIFKRIIKKNFPHLLSIPTLPTPISESLPSQQQQPPTQQQQQDNNLEVKFQNILDFNTTTTTTTTTTTSSTTAKDNDNDTFPTLPKFNPKYEVLRKLSSHKTNHVQNTELPVITLPNTINNISSNNNNTTITSNNNNNLIASIDSNNITTTTTTSSIKDETTTLTSPNSSGKSTTGITIQTTSTSSKSIPFIPKLPINLIKSTSLPSPPPIIPKLDLPPKLVSNDNSSSSQNNNNNNNNNNEDIPIQPKPTIKKTIVPLLNLSKQNSCSSIQIPQCLNQSTISNISKQQIKIPTIVTTTSSSTTTTKSPPLTPRTYIEQYANGGHLPLTQIIQMTQREQINYFEPILNQITEDIFLGSRIPAANLKLLKDNGITHIVNCAGMVCNNHFPQDFTYKTLYISDGIQEDIWCLFYEVIDFIEEAIEQAGKVYIHCHQGISRSSAFVILYIMWKHDWNFQKAHEYTKEIRYISNPNPGFTGQLIVWRKFSKIPLSAQEPKLFRMVQLLGNIIVPKQVYQISYLSLDSRCCFILVVRHCIYLWVGEHCTGPVQESFVEAARKAITRFQKYEKQSSNVIEIKQGQEDQEFWEILSSQSPPQPPQSASPNSVVPTATLTDSQSTTTTTTTTIINFSS
ncbi:MAP kinase phosphatase [Tieghemostelium lacteum]|uniref:MAP kinase phosphatase n=1 Tax=Tieghemostelium lacteum TaxID=361077 RepID=A0A151Z8L7_TIELA|nr:MAP kinase phosphatase [Tieghemostelium lacteum]|eukprot:KYQ90281.1 MAP kinase phosphatase [Tieghemostelium lacteum]